MFPRNLLPSIIILVLLLPQLLAAQNRDEWTIYSAVNRTQDVAFDRAGTLWVATTGGLVAYEASTDSYRYYRTTEGLLRLNSTAIAFDPANGDMYVGSDDGSVSIRKSGGAWKYATEIAGATDRAKRQINGFGFDRGRVYILTAFGIALYNPVDSTVVESYQRLGSIAQYTSTNDMVIWRDSIWVATDAGLAVAPATGRYLAFPDAWRVYGRESGLTSESIASLAIAGDRLQIGTRDSGAYEFNAGVVTRRTDLPANDPIRFASGEAGVVAASYFRVFRYLDGGFREQNISIPEQTRGIDISSSGTIGFGILVNGFQTSSFGLNEGATRKLGEPDSPMSNSFVSLARGDDGAIWAASGEAGAVSRLKEGRWSYYFPPLTTDGVFPAAKAVNRGAGGTIWAGTDPGGFTRFTPNDTGVVIARFDAGNSTLTPVSTNLKRVVGLGAVADESGHTWLVNWDPTSQGPVLHVHLREDEQAEDARGFLAFVTGSLRNYTAIVIDQSGVKWLGSFGDESKPQGLLWYDDNGSVTDKSDDAFGNISEADGLPSSLQTALAIDRDGMLWIGTPKGPAYLANPTGVAKDDQQPSIQKVRPLVDVSVSAVAVDALNRKWIGTDRGVYVLSADGTEVLTHYTVATSPLVDDRVQSLLVDDATGDIYIGTTTGLSRISTEAVRPATPAGPISLSPHPFILPADESLRISGLPESASIKILSLNGSLVRQIQSPGGAVAFWDGRDAAGEPVPTGIYIVAAGASPGEETVVGKIAVIRR